MILDFVLFSVGIMGLIILYIVLSHLSARMGEGMALPGYYRLYFIGILALLASLAAGWSVHYAQKKNLLDILFILLITGNTAAIAASFKYWWWLKHELVKINVGD